MELSLSKWTSNGQTTTRGIQPPGRPNPHALLMLPVVHDIIILAKLFHDIYRGIKSHLEYANTVWSPYKQYLIEEVDKVQKRETKLVHECKHLLYAARLKYLKLPTLKYRRHRGDMIETYKITHGLYDTAVMPNLMMSQVSHTRGNMYKLQKCIQV